MIMSTDNINSFNTIYEFHFDPKKRTISYEILRDEPENILVTPEYKEYCKKENLKFD